MQVDALAEAEGHVDHDGQHTQDDERQFPVDDEHEDGGEANIHNGPNAVYDAPGEQFAHPFGIRCYPAHDPTQGRFAEISQGEVLQMVEEFLAQVVSHALALQAYKVDEDEETERLAQDDGSVNREQLHQSLAVARDDGLIEDALIQKGEIRVHDRNGGDPNQA